MGLRSSEMDCCLDASFRLGGKDLDAMGLCLDAMAMAETVPV